MKVGREILNANSMHARTDEASATNIGAGLSQYCQTKNCIGKHSELPSVIKRNNNDY